MSKKKVLNWMLVVGWMGFIFFMSNQPGEVSSNQSDLVLKVFSLIGIDLNQYWGELATLIIRKIAHFSEYFILYLLVFKAINNRVLKKNIGISLIITCIYAVSDEIHQYFIPGRNMAVLDMLIDSLGAITASLCIIIYRYIISSKSKINKKLN